MTLCSVWCYLSFGFYKSKVAFKFVSKPHCIAIYRVSATFSFCAHPQLLLIFCGNFFSYVFSRFYASLLVPILYVFILYWNTYWLSTFLEWIFCFKQLMLCIIFTSKNTCTKSVFSCSWKLNNPLNIH